ncbi:phosphatase PAP2 family protein [Thiohalomonas denitrificans]|uniref:undecaprenyl-diphosphate phosphatase n=1 Tax=Thiohalomonas denitrificans TaxID=415747 RepID=A0A1G5Q9G5_9GAMM|nr:phosphatase PAP2 family protein [Thiohalomonas denitrificans]SCZ58474.1 undecaprenyl-diphosphatase [Thiohalomonas denitrificans]
MTMGTSQLHSWLLLGFGIGLVFGIRWLALRVVMLMASGWRPVLGKLTPHWRRTRPLRAWVETRIPRTYSFARNRFQPRPFTGLPLTLLTGALAYVFLLMGGLIEELLEATELHAFDQGFNAVLQPLRTPLLVGLFAWLTDLGGSAVLVGVTFVSTGFLWADRRSQFILPLWVAVAGSQLTTWLGKFAFNRDRPEFETFVTAPYASFPSGHATAAMAVYGFIAYALVRDLSGSRTRERFEVIFWSLVIIGTTGFSRVYLGVHYASDVAMGFLVGLFWLLVAFTLTEYQRANRN